MSQVLHLIIQMPTCLLLHIDTVDRLIERIGSAVSAFSSVAISTRPPIHFESMVWPCFVDALCELHYYFSLNEILLICMAAPVSVIVFTALGNEFVYAGDSGRDLNGDTPVPIVLDYEAETCPSDFPCKLRWLNHRHGCTRTACDDSEMLDVSEDDDGGVVIVRVPRKRVFSSHDIRNAA